MSPCDSLLLVLFVTCFVLHVTSGTKRFDSEKAGDREVQRTMLELLNQLDGFQPNHDIKVSVLVTQCAKLSGAVYCYQSCLFATSGHCVCVCVWVCCHDNSKLHASIFTKLGL